MLSFVLFVLPTTLYSCVLSLRPSPQTGSEKERKSICVSRVLFFFLPLSPLSPSTHPLRLPESEIDLEASKDVRLDWFAGTRVKAARPPSPLIHFARDQEERSRRRQAKANWKMREADAEGVRLGTTAHDRATFLRLS